MKTPNPKTSAGGATTNFSIQLTTAERAFVDSQRVELQSAGDVIRSLIRNEMTLFDLPAPIANALRADMKAQGKETREYVRDLLTNHYLSLIGGKGSSPTPRK